MRANKLETALSRDRSYSLSGPTRYGFSYILYIHPQLPGYCRKTEEGWSYSPAAIEVVRSFMEEFPAIFSYLHDKPKEDKYYESEILAGSNG